MNKTPVLVTWRDIATWAGWNQEFVESGLAIPPTIQTVGFIIKNNKDILLISDTYPEIGTVTAFPRGCVEKIEKLHGKKSGKDDVAVSQRPRGVPASASVHQEQD